MSSSRRWWSTWRVRTLAVLLLAFAALNLLAYNHARKMLVFVDGGERTEAPEELSPLAKARTLLFGIRVPRPEASTPLMVSCKDVRIDVPDESVTLGATLCSHGVDAPLVILFHGYAEEKTSLALEAAELYRHHKASVLLVDFRGSGDSSGSYTTIGVDEARDVAAAVAYAKMKVPHTQRVLFGRSMGGAAVLRAIHAHGVDADGVIVEAVFDSLLETVRQRFRSMGLPTFPLAELLVFWGGHVADFDGFGHDPVDYAASLDMPTLVLHGGRDPRVSVEQARRVADAVAGERRFVVFEGLGHEPYLLTRRVAWRRSVGMFLRRLDPTRGVDPSLVAATLVRIGAEQAARVAVESFLPSDDAVATNVGIMPLRAAMADWLSSDRPSHQVRMPEALSDWQESVGAAGAWREPPTVPELDHPHYVVRGTVREPNPHPMAENRERTPDPRRTFRAVVDAQDGTLRDLACSTPDRPSNQQEGPPQRSYAAPYVRLTPYPSPQPSEQPSSTPRFTDARRLVEQGQALERGTIGTSLARTLDLFPLWPGNRWIFRSVEGQHGCSAWMRRTEFEDTITVVDARGFGPELAVFRLSRARRPVAHPTATSRADVRHVPGREAGTRTEVVPLFILLWRDEVYRTREVDELRDWIAYFQRAPVPAAASRRSVPFRTDAVDRPLPMLRLPLRTGMAPIPGAGAADWTPPTEEPAGTGATRGKRCATITTEIGSSVRWQTFCEGVGWANEGGYTANSDQLRWWRELMAYDLGE